MSRLTPLDKALAVILVSLWAVCFSLSLRSTFAATALSPVGVSAPADEPGHPIITDHLYWLWREAEESGLRYGDRLISLGDRDLLGTGTVAFLGRFSEAADADRRVTVGFERAGERATTSLQGGSYAFFAPMLPSSFILALAGIVLLLRVQSPRLARTVFQGFMCAAVCTGSFFAATVREAYAQVGIQAVGAAALPPLALRAVLLFPGGVPPKAAARVGPWLLLPAGPLATSSLYGVPWSSEIGVPGVMAMMVLGCAALLAIATREYRRSDPIGRRKLKWAIFGAYCGIAPTLAAAAFVLVSGDSHLIRFVWMGISLWGIVPLFLFIAIKRYNLFDIDRLISATASYHVLAVLGIGAGLVVIPRISQAFSTVLGIEPLVGQVLSSLILAALVIPAHRRLRPQIERVFFSERYALEQGVGRLLGELSACRTPQELTRLAGEKLAELLRPESCVIYARGERVFSPVFVRAQAAPAAFHVNSPLVAALEERRLPLAPGRLADRRLGPELSPFDRAALETLGIPMVVPVRRGRDLVAFLCLGPKRSGDVYTSTDLSLLTAVVDKVSTELLRFDDAQIIRQGREMQEKLRRYVPGAVADRISSGQKLETGEREVTVLFVDIRGYTALSESRRAEDIFSTVNRYTETVSEIVRKHGGSVVEFNGDGMMAVFGAPQALDRKERAAVRTGREIDTAVGGLSFEGISAGEKLTVGVGIATGEAFVGNIRAVDRMIWSAIGNTTNLAARLQTLTRDLDAAVVIDASTWEALDADATDFEKREGVQIRGRSRSRDVYVLSVRALR